MSSNGMLGKVYDILDSIFGDTPQDNFAVSVSPREGKITMPNHVSLEGLTTLPQDLRDKITARFRGNTVTLVVAA